MNSGFAGTGVGAAKQADILLAVVDRLRSEISEFDSDTLCYITNVPWPGIEVTDNLFCTVCPTSDSFDPGSPVGAGENLIIENSLVQVSIWSRLLLDEAEHAEIALTDAERGLLTMKQKVLAALAGRQLFADPPDNTVPLLIEYLKPTTSVHPAPGSAPDDFSSCSLTFAASFYWDLS